VEFDQRDSASTTELFLSWEFKKDEDLHLVRPSARKKMDTGGRSLLFVLPSSQVYT
jgi:hypothetical protein